MIWHFGILDTVVRCLHFITMYSHDILFCFVLLCFVYHSLWPVIHFACHTTATLYVILTSSFVALFDAIFDVIFNIALLYLSNVRWQCLVVFDECTVTLRCCIFRINGDIALLYVSNVQWHYAVVFVECTVTLLCCICYPKPSIDTRGGYSDASILSVCLSVCLYSR